MNPLSEINQILENPGVYAERYKAESGKRVVGYLCSYAPEELIYAAGVHPFRLFGTGGAISLADAHLQAYCCSLVRGVLEDALSGRLDFLDGTVFPHTCDSVQRLSDIWRLNIPFGFHTDVVLPVKLNTPSARRYMIDVLSQFRRDMEKIMGFTISDDQIRDAVRLYNQIRGNLRKIDAFRYDRPHLISGSDFHHLVKASMIMDRRHVAALLERVAAMLGARQDDDSGAGKKRLILAGGLCNHPDIYPVIEAAGGVVVGDDFCTGSRYFEGVINDENDPLAALADRYLSRVVCPAKHADLSGRADHLVQLVKSRKADGVVFLLLKFCDPHAFDYPYLKNRLDGEGIPSALFEVEDQLPAEGSLKTRIEAFIEML